MMKEKLLNRLFLVFFWAELSFIQDFISVGIIGAIPHLGDGVGKSILKNILKN